MCGIAGVLGKGIDERDLRAMAATLRHRGPDDEGIWTDAGAGVGLVHRRLAIVDLSSAGHQPMLSAHGRYVMIFNGEIYNHAALRVELEAARAAPAWRGHSDTETLLACFEVWGIEDTIVKAVGMFALALWDRNLRVLTLARDRLGEKPMYYGWNNGSFLFGSELKALRAHSSFDASINRDAAAAFLRYGYVPTPHSIYDGIHKLPPGTLLCLSPTDKILPAPRAYWSLVEVARRGLTQPFLGSDVQAMHELRSRLLEAVSLQRIADVPLGAFLSGGIDSSLIVALMQAGSSARVHTFTIGFEDPQYDEAVHARAVARHLGTHHQEICVTSEEARNVIPLLPTLYDEPFADVSQIPTFLVSRLARRHVTVSLSGDAGDELFGGYNRYQWVGRLLKYPAFLRVLFAGGLKLLTPDQWDRAYSVARFLPSSLNVRTPGDKAHKLAGVIAAGSDAILYQRLISSWFNPNDLMKGGREGTDIQGQWESLADFGAPQNRMMAIDALTYLSDDILCKVDRAAMGVSLETRLPFLDHRVVEFAWRLPLHMKIRQGVGKWLVRQLLYQYVPKALVERPKMGFAVPLDAWLRGPLREWAEALLDESVLAAQDYLNPAPIRQKWQEHLTGKRNWQYPLWNILMFQAWLQQHR